MRLISTTDVHLGELMEWFKENPHDCMRWGGPEFRHPYTKATFREDARYAELPSYSLINENDELLGFGQYYERKERCHLARLAVTPERRGQGLGKTLVRELSRRGCKNLEVDHCSLFVLSDNTPAVRLYQRLGFVPTTYPGDMPAEVEGCIYMVASAEEIVH